MADVFTSIKTTGGWADAAAAALAYDLMFRGALRSYPVMRQFIDERPNDVTSQAKAYRLFVDTDFSEASVTAAQTPLDEETDVAAIQFPAPTSVDLTPNEFGFGTLRTLKLSNRALVPLDPKLARAVAYHMVRTIDGLIQAKAAAGTNQVYANGRANLNALVAGDVIKAQDVRTQVAKLRNDQVEPVDGQFYAAVIHPYTELSLREETGSGGWRVPNEYGASQNRIWTGEIGEFEGARFTTNARTLTGVNSGPITYYRSYFMGRGALAEAVNVEPEIRIAPVIDRLSRFRGLGWYADLDFQVFRQKALRVFNSALTAADATALA